MGITFDDFTIPNHFNFLPTEGMIDWNATESSTEYERKILIVAFSTSLWSLLFSPDWNDFLQNVLELYVKLTACQKYVG